jgi:hypothetical protein
VLSLKTLFKDLTMPCHPGAPPVLGKNGQEGAWMGDGTWAYLGVRVLAYPCSHGHGCEIVPHGDSTDGDNLSR